MYILDNKRNLGSFIIPVDSDNKIKVFREFEVQPQNLLYPQFGVYNNGDIVIGNVNNPNNVNITGGIDFTFERITTLDTDYILTENNYALEIVSDTYNFITLPLATGIGGRTYRISRGSDNDSLVLRCQPGDNIDSRSIIELKRKFAHLTVMSNNINSWYFV